MPVVYNLPQLYKLCEKSSQSAKDNLIKVHRELLCNPLKTIFPKRTIEEIHFELLRNGLFDPYEGLDIAATIKELEQQNVWGIVQKEFEKLRSLWRGPDIPIYIFPLTKHRPMIDGMEVKKNGVAYNDAIFLFISKELVEIELKALLAHEYHHICRLSHIKKAPQEIELIESLIIEGMAEWEVEKLYGEAGLSPWTKQSSFEELKEQWQKYYAPNMYLLGVENHYSFLYGDESLGLPSWIGYCIGYRIIESYVKNVGSVESSVFYRISSEKIIQGSDFKPS
ncbi:DUF2268 domain-containing putative Zn-dependent protease [Lysinibacillus telephonicus]|uniref:DUF2268 domain-containing protein n=1 Tax=Lysinibacillus telephonicus TaxID=1714840 RepID=A0A431UR79_9BACI|nr:DUF2268 domain-containing putative Zn-dependent protease [Lysinibacillus telephonicus]RTQ92736.1 hypothetical protein EKG35_11255 [Lysinibacillus telephonicus]